MKTQKLFNVKKIVSVGLTSCILLLVTNVTNAQWGTFGASIYNTNIGNVGINQNVPNSLLHIKQNGTGTSNGIRFETSLSTSEDWYMYMNASDDLIINNDANATHQLLLQKNTGNMSLGNITPNEKLNVSGAIKLGAASGSNSGTIQWDGTNFQGYDGSSWKDFGSSWTQRASGIEYNTGFVGIGTNSPSTTLHVVDQTTNLERIQFDTDILLPANHDLISIQIPTGSSDTAQFIEFENGSSFVAQIYGNGAGYFKGGMRLGGSSINQLPTEMLEVTGNGIVQGDLAVAGSIIHPSDKNLKENIETIKNGLSLINQLNATTYSHKADKAEEFGLSTKPQYGLIAQEVEEVIPALVIQKALKGEDGTIYKGLDYEKLIPILVAALQEEHAQKEALKVELTDKIDAQQNQINQILSKLNTEQVSK